ncbi:MAG: hypothetical protein M3Y04_09735 [Actinomycetota bacterium]|nr:hypothetical protein [Actinomycetota bacterium]
MAVVGMVALSAGAAPAASLKDPEVDAAVQVTADAGPARGHATPVLAVSPDDPQTMVLAEGDAYASRCMVHVTRNGGLTWALTAQPQTPPDWPGCGFAVTGPLADLAFAPDGTLYYAFSAYQPATYQQRIYLARSSDLGLHWDTTALPRIGPNPATREMGADAMPSIVVDRSAPGRVYVSWWSGNGTWNFPESITGASSSVWCRLVDNKIVARPWAAVSQDGGRTFGNPVDMAPGVDLCTTEPYLAQAKDGALLAFFGQVTRSTDPGKAPPANLFFSRSTDQGRTFTVTPIHAQSGPTDGKAATSTSDWLSGPSPAVDLKTGTIYVTWEELGEGVPRILLKRSTDNGATWSQPVKVNDVDPKRDWDFAEQFPTMGVAPDGRVDIAWYDYRNDPTYKAGDTDNGFQDVYYASSTDGGRTFSKNVKLNDRAIDRRFGPRSTGSIYGPLGLVSTDTSAAVAWDDTRNGNQANGAQDIYFTRARYEPAAVVFGGKTGSTTSPLAAGFLGAAAALAFGGLVLVTVTQGTVKDKDPKAPTSTGTVPAKEASVT